MKTAIKTLLMLAALGCASCVQPTQRQTVVYTLDVSSIKHVRTVGLRGSDKPLSWEVDLPMQLVEKGKMYRAVVTYQTGFRCTEVKFVVNDTFELAQQDNRKIYFRPIRDTTYYQAIFDRRSSAGGADFQ